jgi:hypothetical protein
MKLLLILLLSGCTNVYVQTGDGSIERSIDVERKIERSKNGNSTDSRINVQR